MQTNKRYTVRVVELGSTERVHETRVLATDEPSARNQAITKLFGRMTFWQADSGLGRNYGQVFQALPNSGSGFQATSRTGRARLEAVHGW
jgi:hypothetical protein